MEAFVGRIRRKKVPNSESYVSEGKKNVNLSKVSNSLFRKISYIYCMQTKLSTRQKKNNPLLLLMLIRRDLSLKEAFYDLHCF